MAGINFIDERGYGRKLVAKKPCVYTQLCGDSEPLVCPDCKQPFTKEEIAIKEHCNNCGWEFAN
jgi:ribosomal protein L37AE/L43A